jgi:hypothetical protein
MFIYELEFAVSCGNKEGLLNQLAKRNSYKAAELGPTLSNK